ncbi:matrix-remodeling-associated protein 8-like protein [Lates japonicus]|uniref:Matrix-remodeling-associated protein 8-like protein n=1 Tax=Lates japonicus TaxID=270547 RepID=A0AAD3NKH4_LATJO|nr:matrix-remodeling-associated protein 8-like protein [Lates japonicus]
MQALKLTLSVCLATCFPTCLDSGDLQEMEVKPGADVLLQCQGPRDADIRLLKWSRPDLESEGYVYFFRDNHLYEDIQHPSFHGRVKLRDPHMKDEDFSVTLKNVNVNDTGRYECEIINSKTGGKPELISTINLKVEPGHTLGDGEDRENRNGGNDDGGKDGGNVGLDVILSVAVLCIFQLIRTVPGQTVTLPCRAPRNTNIKAVEWTRTDLETDYVLLYWDEWPDPEKQHPSFQNRVELRDSQMKDGDLSLFLKDVTRDDSGIYKCRVQRKTNYWKRSYLDATAISVIYLKVEIIQNITAVSGDNVTLPCRALSNIPILVAEWTRPDLEPEHVLYQQLSWSIAQYQHPFFKNRVKLEESKMENGDASLILKL